MKKIAGILVLVLVLGLTGCKSSATTSENTDKSNVKVEDKTKDKEKEDVNADVDVESKIDQLNSLIDSKKYDEANSLAQELSNKKMNESQKAEVNKLKTKIDSESAKAKVDTNNAKQETKVQQSKKQEYKTKLDNIEISLKALEQKEASGTTYDMRSAANERYKKWDAALNEIYGVLKGQLSATDMKKLQSEEIKWISDRDAKAKKEASEMKGGTMEPVLYIRSLADTTKARCYELIEKYMQ
ncbi:DUF1311 domain-containing protein [Clostridium sp. PL3]|uniref:DUF1311 domain-containing protein n=1 Tax=Clostridium thailandense TaxID=2794346 RepID=A0A949WTN1_9CLOT|nr:lysozyme inhibitor LprI family protein [Clostridium thailandense]MBV7276396.1 DUF1311 domain-containing protein [Clostridium thailandense]